MSKSTAKANNILSEDGICFIYPNRNPELKREKARVGHWTPSIARQAASDTHGPYCFAICIQCCFLSNGQLECKLINVHVQTSFSSSSHCMCTVDVMQANRVTFLCT